MGKYQPRTQALTFAQGASEGKSLGTRLDKCLSYKHIIKLYTPPVVRAVLFVLFYAFIIIYKLCQTWPMIPTKLIAFCLLLIAHCSLLIASCSLLIASCSLLIASCSLLIAHWSLLVAHCPLLIAHCSLLIAHALLLAHCLSNCLLLVALCSLLWRHLWSITYGNPRMVKLNQFVKY